MRRDPSALDGKRILDAFSGLDLYNIYGPTETQAVTDVLVTGTLLEEYRSIPVGVSGKGSEVVVLDGSGNVVPVGCQGEICIIGDTLSLGYYYRPGLTERTLNVEGAARRGYLTGDEGYFDEKGMLLYLGRKDTQVKISGFRIELEEVEGKLLTMHNACVVVERAGEGLSDALVAFVVQTAGAEGGLQKTRQIKHALKSALPSYMIPRKVKYLDSILMNSNGKADRRLLVTMA